MSSCVNTSLICLQLCFRILHGTTRSCPNCHAPRRCLGVHVGNNHRASHIMRRCNRFIFSTSYSHRNLIVSILTSLIYSKRRRWEPSNEAAPEVHTLASVPCITKRDSVMLLGGSQNNEFGLCLAEVHQAIQVKAAQFLIHALRALGLLLAAYTLSYTIIRNDGVPATSAEFFAHHAYPNDAS